MYMQNHVHFQLFQRITNLRFVCRIEHFANMEVPESIQDDPGATILVPKIVKSQTLGCLHSVLKSCCMMMIEINEGRRLH